MSQKDYQSAVALLDYAKFVLSQVGINENAIANNIYWSYLMYEQERSDGEDIFEIILNAEAKKNALDLESEAEIYNYLINEFLALSASEETDFSKFIQNRYQYRQLGKLATTYNPSIDTYYRSAYSP